MSKVSAWLAIATGLAAANPMVSRNDGIARRSLGPSGTPKRNQERAIKRMAQRSRAINRMKRK